LSKKGLHKPIPLKLQGQIKGRLPACKEFFVHDVHNPASTPSFRLPYFKIITQKKHPYKPNVFLGTFHM
jgi:hypothetical protein